MTINDLIKSYLSSTEFKLLESNSQLAYRSRLKTITNLKKDSYKGIIEAITGISDDSLKISNSTKQVLICALHKVLDHQTLNGNLPDTLTRSGQVFRFPKAEPEPNAATKTEIEAVRASATGTEKLYANFITALFYTGCRPDELYNLKWEHVDEDYVYIYGAKRREKGKLSRICKITEPLKEALQFAKDNHHKGKNLDLVFTGVRGEKLNPQYTRRVAKKLYAKCNIPSMRNLRSLRSGLATAMHKSGYDIIAIQSQLGHKNITTTRRYIQLNLKEKAELFKGV